MSGLGFISPEEPDTCETCGKFDELRPYGLNGERICYDCGEKLPKEHIERMIGIYVFGDPKEIN